MRTGKIFAAAIVAATTAFAGSPASAQEDGMWAGPYRGWFYGRMSGTAYGTVVLHVSPDAASTRYIVRSDAR